MSYSYNEIAVALGRHLGFSVNKCPKRKEVDAICRAQVRPTAGCPDVSAETYFAMCLSRGDKWAVDAAAMVDRRLARRKQLKIVRGALRGQKKAARREKKYPTHAPAIRADRRSAYGAANCPIGAPHPDYVRDDGFYKTRAWREMRMVALKAAGGRCACCGASAKDGARLHVDHIKPRYKRPDLSLDPSNLQVLCEDCNLGKGAWDDTDWR